MPDYANKWLFLFFMFFVLSGCAHHNRPENLGPVPESGLKDGVYSSSISHFPGRADVEVEIADGRVVKIRVLHHRAFLGTEAKEIMPGRILEAQSTDVDAVSGATGSSYIILEAVQEAVDQARIGR